MLSDIIRNKNKEIHLYQDSMHRLNEQISAYARVISCISQIQPNLIQHVCTMLRQKEREYEENEDSNDHQISYGIMCLESIVNQNDPLQEKNDVSKSFTIATSSVSQSKILMLDRLHWFLLQTPSR